ncbi:MAG: excinuclease ABC subunit UvrC [Myxococcota bacterium]
MSPNPIRKRIANLPAQPGCYLMKDAQGRVFYIGKAVHLRNRIHSYFSGQDNRPFVRFLDELLVDIDTIVVRNEVEALLLERSLIRKHKPRFNILLRDDSNYLMLRLAQPVSAVEKLPATTGCPADDQKAAAGKTAQQQSAQRLRTQYPRLEIVRSSKNDKAHYFGPYPNASALRQLVRFVNKQFQLRTCTDRVLESRLRPCLQYQMKRCPAPCCFAVPQYQQELQQVELFLNGHIQQVCQQLKKTMLQHAQQANFEQAARVRDQIAAIQTSIVDQAAVAAGSASNHDVFAVARSGPALVIAQLLVRGGQLLGSRNHLFDNQEFPTAELLASFLPQLYENSTPQQLPQQIVLDTALANDDNKALMQHLTQRKGKRVRLWQPQRGHAKKLLLIAHKNAHAALQAQLKQQDINLKCLQSLQQRLGLASVPKRMECFDVSLLQGSDAMASCVCFIDGVASKKHYRLFRIKTVAGIDDYAMLREALLRRLKKGIVAADLPNLLLVDGGKGQLAVALAVCKDLGIAVGKKHLYVAGIAKARQLADARNTSAHPTKHNQQQHSATNHNKLFGSQQQEIHKSPERLFVPGVKDPLILRPHTQERYLIERIRNEAHRFAITAHRHARKQRTLTSALDHIPGIGATRKKLLLRTLGSVQAIQNSDPNTLADIPGIGPALAEQIVRALRG